MRLCSCFGREPGDKAAGPDWPETDLQSIPRCPACGGDRRRRLYNESPIEVVLRWRRVDAPSLLGLRRCLPRSAARSADNRTSIRLLLTTLPLLHYSLSRLNRCPLPSRTAGVRRRGAADPRRQPADAGLAGRCGGEVAADGGGRAGARLERAAGLGSHALLKPGGILWITTPNLTSRGHALFGRDWIGLDPPRHLVLFKRDSLARAVASTGFKIDGFGSDYSAQSFFPFSATIAANEDPRDERAIVRHRDRRSIWVGDMVARFAPWRAENIVLMARFEERSVSAVIASLSAVLERAARSRGGMAPAELPDSLTGFCRSNLERERLRGVH